MKNRNKKGIKRGKTQTGSCGKECCNKAKNAGASPKGQHGCS